MKDECLKKLMGMIEDYDKCCDLYYSTFSGWTGNYGDETFEINSHRDKINLTDCFFWISAGNLTSENLYIFDTISSDMPILIDGNFEDDITEDILGKLFSFDNVFYECPIFYKGEDYDAIDKKGLGMSSIDVRLLRYFLNGNSILLEPEQLKQLDITGLTSDNFEKHLLQIIEMMLLKKFKNVTIIENDDCFTFYRNLKSFIEETEINLEDYPLTFLFDEKNDDKGKMLFDFQFLGTTLLSDGINSNKLLQLRTKDLGIISMGDCIKLNRIFDIISGYIPENASQLDIVTYISLFLVRHIDYDYDNYYKNKAGTGSIPLRTTLEVLEGGIGVCRDYADVMKWLFQKFDIDCQYISAVDKNNRSGHAFNLVTIDGIPYWIDNTWQKTGKKNTKLDLSPYYLISTQDFLKTHGEYEEEISKYDCPETYSREKILESIRRVGKWKENYCISNEQLQKLLLIKEYREIYLSIQEKNIGIDYRDKRGNLNKRGR